MKTLGTIIGMIPVIALAIAISCGESEVMEPAFVQRNTVFYAASGPDEAYRQVEGNYAKDKQGRPLKYSGRVLLLQDAIEIYYEFVGATFGPYSLAWREWEHADVYVVAVTGKDIETEIIPVVYRGGKTVVVDRPDLRVVLGPKKSMPIP